MCDEPSLEALAELRKYGLTYGVYTCRHCCTEMFFEDENRSVLICPGCNYTVDIDYYATPEEYEGLYFADDIYDANAGLEDDYDEYW